MTTTTRLVLMLTGKMWKVNKTDKCMIKDCKNVSIN